ncbi:hypothetical protein [Crossiella sp. CA198]|uniref:hypothetical protein n=1 Tax=Crossiella sp. CA198 TaxID=3455607 RepID=UPI003F8D8B07
MAGYKVITTAVRTEAAKWDEFAKQIAPAHSAASGMTLSPLAFFVLDPITLMVFPLNLPTPPEELASSYEAVRSFMEKLLSGAKTEFSEIGDALVKIANTYDQNEAIVEMDLNEVF